MHSLRSGLQHDGKPVLTFAMAYGFRNIQNIVRKIKSKQCNYDYIEIMACPSGSSFGLLGPLLQLIILAFPGCLNGGGQIKAEAPKTVKEVLRGVEMTYSQQILRYPLESQLAESIYTDIVGAGPMSNQAQALFHTTYHAVAKLEIKSPLTIQW
jgi:iron only hydrogenase large subunit-like protein